MDEPDFPAARSATRILITNVDSVVGSNLALALADRAEVRGLCRHQLVAIPGVTVTAWLSGDLPAVRTDPRTAAGALCDREITAPPKVLGSALRDYPKTAAAALCGRRITGRQTDLGSALRRCVARWAPQWILHCGPLASSSWDAPSETPWIEEELAVTGALAELARQSCARLTVVSTDAVFAGPRMFHDEQSPATCDLPFARAARAVEECLADRPGVLLVRTHAYGWSPVRTLTSFAERVWQTLSERAQPTLRHPPPRHADPGYRPG